MASIKENHIERLTGSENYSTWAFSVKSLLEYHDLEKCIMPSASATSAPAETEPDKLKKAKARIILSIDKHLFVHVASCETALEIWLKLKNMYEDNGLSRRIGLLRKLITSNLENFHTMDEYISEIIGTANKLNSIGFVITEEWIGSILLAGLSDEFKPFIMAVENSGALITGDSIKAKLCEMKSSKNDNDSSAFFGKKKQKSGDIVCYECNKSGHFRRDCSVWKRKQSKTNGHAKSNVSDKKQKSAFSAVLSSKSRSCDEWFVDSGASQHMCASDREMFNVRASTTKFINSANGAKMAVKCVGDMSACINGNEIDIKNVLCVPELAANLLSISCITKSGNSVNFVRDGCEIYNHSNSLLCKAILEDGVYKLPIELNVALLSKTKTKKECIMVWHRRLGHLNIADLTKVLKNANIDFDNSNSSSKCEACIMAKHARQPFNHKGKRASNPLQVIHFDLCGPMEQKSIGNARYFLTFIDDFSRKNSVYFLKHKSELFGRFKEYKAMVEKQTGRKIKCIRSDNAGENTSNEFKTYLKKCGIVHQTSVPYNPEQNGLAERMNRTLVERAKSMLFDAGLPKKFWAEAINTASYVINRSIASGTSRIPEEIWTGSAIDLSDLKVFGMPAMTYIPKEKRLKWDPKSKPLIFVGYELDTKGYRLIDPENDKLVISRDIIMLDKRSSNDVSALLESDEQSIAHNDVSVGEYEQENDIVNDADLIVTSSPTAGTRVNVNELDSVGASQQIWMDYIDLSESFHSTQTDDDDMISCNNSDDEKDRDYVPDDTIIPTKIHQTRSKANASYALYIANGSNRIDPVTVREALCGENKAQWQAAMADELKSLAENGTWELVDLPAGKKILRTMWVFKTKLDDNGNVQKYKARLVAKGCAQVPGRDFGETFSPVIRYNSIRFLVALAARKGFKIDQMDAVTAFLQGDLNEDIFIQQPEGFSDKTNRVCHLKKAMYGLKQSSRQWNRKLNDALEKYGLTRSKIDPCVYVQSRDGQVVLIVAIYVDDMLIFWKKNDDLINAKVFLSNSFKMKDLGRAKNCVGLKISYDKFGNYYLDQSAFINSVLDKFRMENCNPISTPSDPNQKLNKSMSPTTEEQMKEAENHPYQQLVGALLYLVQGTRPDIAFSVTNVSRFNNCHGKAHWAAAKRILRYLKGTIDFKLRYLHECKQNIHGFTDSDWGADIDKRRSCTGYVFQLQSGAISWSSRFQPTVAQSTTEAEYMALGAGAQEALWLKQFNQQLGCPIADEPIRVSCDNMGAIHLASNDAYLPRTKHIDIKHHFVRECINKKKIMVHYISTDKMVADSLTKSVTANKLSFCSRQMGLIYDQSS